MVAKASDDRVLPANDKLIRKRVKECIGSGGPAEFRIAGQRGLVLNVMPSGTATWYLHYDIPQGRKRVRRKLKLGRLDDLPLGNATKRVEELRPTLSDGGDPAKERGDARQAMTFAELAEARFASGDPLRVSTEKDSRAVLKADILPYVGTRPARGVTRQDVIDIKDRMAERGATRRADTARAVMSSIYAFALDRGLALENPASGLKNRHDNRAREVIFTPDQLRKFWQALEADDAPASRVMARIFRITLLTGQRRGEVAQARVTDFVNLDGAEPEFVIGRDSAKNHTAHRVPLSPQAVAEIKRAIADAGDSAFLFPNFSVSSSTGHMMARGVSRSMERLRDTLHLGDVRTHDLRRTVGTMMTKFGVPKDIRSRVLNHGGKRRSAGVTEATYSWYDHAIEKRAALELWGDALACIVEGQKGEIEDFNARVARLKGSAKILIG
jgi:integrase